MMIIDAVSVSLRAFSRLTISSVVAWYTVFLARAKPFAARSSPTAADFSALRFIALANLISTYLLHIKHGLRATHCSKTYLAGSRYSSGSCRSTHSSRTSAAAPSCTGGTPGKAGLAVHRAGAPAWPPSPHISCNASLHHLLTLVSSCSAHARRSSGSVPERSVSAARRTSGRPCRWHRCGSS